jgi:hypothetical protein
VYIPGADPGKHRQNLLNVRLCHEYLFPVGSMNESARAVSFDAVAADKLALGPEKCATSEFRGVSGQEFRDKITPNLCNGLLPSDAGAGAPQILAHPPALH